MASSFPPLHRRAVEDAVGRQEAAAFLKYECHASVMEGWAGGGRSRLTAIHGGSRCADARKRHRSAGLRCLRLPVGWKASSHYNVARRFPIENSKLLLEKASSEPTRGGAFRFWRSPGRTQRCEVLCLLLLRHSNAARLCQCPVHLLGRKHGSERYTGEPAGVGHGLRSSGGYFIGKHND
jgi:hypothetical protein